jgi:hypothetical protein
MKRGAAFLFGLSGLLLVAFIALNLFGLLKLYGAVAWPWWLVLAPAWAPLALITAAWFIITAVEAIRS